MKQRTLLAFSMQTPPTQPGLPPLLDVEVQHEEAEDRKAAKEDAEQRDIRPPERLRAAVMSPTPG